MEACPKCGAILTQLREEYRSLGTYIYIPEKDKYELKTSRDVVEEIKYICPFCGEVLPMSLVSKLLNKLPRI